MVYGETPEFETAMATITALARRLKWTRYGAANWQLLGLTTERGKDDQPTSQTVRSKKYSVCL